VDVYEYFISRERECREHSLAPDTSFADLFSEEEGSGGKRGIMFGRLVLNERAFLSVSEEIEVVKSGVRRVSYSYYLIVDGVEVWGYDRDPSHVPSEHKHLGADHQRLPCGRVSFLEAVERAWATVSLDAETAPLEE
jgi:hypothetical protein